MIKYCILACILFHLIASVFTVGYYHPDEHFQILEFANYKLGKISAASLPWEYEAKIRPWFHPALMVGLIKFFNLLGVENPFTLATISRLFASVFSVLSLLSILSCFPKWLYSQSKLKWGILFTLLLWYVPYLGCRFSSEGMSTSLFWIAFCPLILQVQNKQNTLSIQKLILYGLLLGLATQIRYQVGIMVVSGLLWYLVNSKSKISNYIFLALGLVTSVGIGIYCDYWGYGAWQFTPWLYFKENILLNRAAMYGVHPFWYYFYAVAIKAFPLSTILMLGVFLCWLYKPKLSLTWATLPFALIHCFLSHKELRFIFPILPVAPVMGLLAYQELEKRKSTLITALNKTPRFLFRGVLGFNFILLFIISFWPIREEILYLQYLYDNKVTKIYSPLESPYILAGLNFSFYRAPNQQVEVVQSEVDFKNKTKNETKVWIYDKNSFFIEKVQPLFKQCTAKYLTLPNRIQNAKVQDFLKKTRYIERTIYLCEK